MAAQPLTNWSTDLCSCCDDTNSCCYGFWCCPCLACTVAGMFGENRCVPLCDICTTSLFSAFGIPLSIPPAALSLRVGIRYKYGIKSSLCTDFIASCFCVWCSWCQMHRELKIRKKNTNVINMQPASIISSEKK